MKKIAALLSMAACMLFLPVSAQAADLTDYEQQKLANAQSVASQLVYLMAELSQEQENASVDFNDYTAEEIAYIISQNYQYNVEGNAVKTGVTSFRSAFRKIGDLVSVGETTAEIDGDQIVVLVEVEGETRNAQAEIIVSNDMFFILQSAALNPASGMGEKMAAAALNTVLGLLTVFSVLIIIIGIISCFRFIPALQARFSGKGKEGEAREPSVSAALSEPEEEAGQETDDLELAAVIAAAIAASGEAVTTDGFVVRSIRRRNRR
ncbi:MAG: OadG family protein [Clostridium sp.]|jgi:Na+-transporting methylmalonyl-CoA/oxaloacetate decarboxylase gamma subunit|nr:OadG family protein [Clostridium sp.]